MLIPVIDVVRMWLGNLERYGRKNLEALAACRWPYLRSCRPVERGPSSPSLGLQLVLAVAQLDEISLCLDQRQERSLACRVGRLGQYSVVDSL